MFGYLAAVYLRHTHVRYNQIEGIAIGGKVFNRLLGVVESYYIVSLALKQVGEKCNNWFFIIYDENFFLRPFSFMLGSINGCCETGVLLSGK